MTGKLALFLALPALLVFQTGALGHVPTSQEKCPDDTWKKSERNWCYKQFEAELPMASAESFCQSFGAHLVSILDGEENKFVTDHTYQTWLGLKLVDRRSSRRDNKPSDFSWTDASNATYLGFVGVEPNTNNGETKCVVGRTNYITYELEWESQDCAVEDRFMCKIAAGPAAADFTTNFPPTNPPPLAVPCGAGGGRGWVQAAAHDHDKSLEPFCYLFKNSDRMTFIMASQVCRQNGGHLVSIHSEAENRFVLANLGIGGNLGTWIGFNSMYTGEFVWTDGTDISFQRWNSGEPNTEKLQEDCVIIDGEKGGWSDESCISKFTFACKKYKRSGLATSTATPRHTTEARRGYCPDGFRQLLGQCYKLVQAPATWKEAVKQCRAMGGDGYSLASAHTPKENALMAAILSAKQGKSSAGQVWIGGSYSIDQRFEWSDYSTFNFENWATHHPNFQGILNCLTMYDDSVDQNLGKWGNDDCSKQLNYICKGQVSPSNDPPKKKKCKIVGFESYTPYKDDCYLGFPDATKSWHEAEKDCMSRGTHLVSIQDWGEQAGLFAVIGKQDIWIGLQDIKPNMNGVLWSDGNLVKIHNWAAFELTDRPSCVYMNSTNGRWYPQDCGQKLNYVCKASNATPATKGPNFKGYCPIGFEDAMPGGDHCYRIDTDTYQGLVKEEWSHAEISCREHGSYLASIGSAQEALAIKAMFQKAKLNKKSNGLWIGLIAYRDAMGLGPLWRWSDGSGKLDYSWWEEGYPTNLFSTAAQCAYITTNGKWRNTDCNGLHDSDSPNYHVCKIAKVGGQEQENTTPIPSGANSLGKGSTYGIVACWLLGLLAFAMTENIGLSRQG